MKYQAENTVSSFFYYMWNAWSEEECKTVYGGMYPHFWENGAWRQTRAHSARRNGSTWNSRKTTARFWWNGPSRYMTDRPQKQEQKHKKSNSMQGNIISLISSSCGCSQTEAQEYLDSEIRYLRELQEADDLREDDMETACLNLGLDLDYREYFINRLAGA